VRIRLYVDTMSDNPSFVLKKIDDVAFEERPIPKIDSHEVLVAVKKTGRLSVESHYY
jgi:D-xylulose reductase